MIWTESNTEAVAESLGISVHVLTACRIVLADDRKLTGKIISLDFETGDLVMTFDYHDLNEVGHFYPIEFKARLGYFRLESTNWRKSFIPFMGAAQCRES